MSQVRLREALPPKSWSQAFADALVSGSVASALSTAALSAQGRREIGSAAAPTNATSHWFWPTRALAAHEPSLRYTGTGYLIHHAMSVLWAVLYEKFVTGRGPGCPPQRALGGALAAATVACAVDFTCTPARLTPGFEHRLSKPALATVYVAFGVGLALTTMLRARRLARARGFATNRR